MCLLFTSVVYFFQIRNLDQLQNDIPTRHKLPWFFSSIMGIFIIKYENIGKNNKVVFLRLSPGGKIPFSLELMQVMAQTHQ